MAYFQKELAWKKITTKKPKFKYHGCDKRWQTPGHRSVTSQLGKMKQGPEEEWQVHQKELFSGFCLYVTHCISFKVCFNIVYKLLTDLQHMTGSLEHENKNKNKDPGEIFKVSFNQSSEGRVPVWLLGRPRGAEDWPPPLVSFPVLFRICLKSELDLGNLLLSQYFYHHQLVIEWETIHQRWKKKKKRGRRRRRRMAAWKLAILPSVFSKYSTQDCLTQISVAWLLNIKGSSVCSGDDANLPWDTFQVWSCQSSFSGTESYVHMRCLIQTLPMI